MKSNSGFRPSGQQLTSSGMGGGSSSSDKGVVLATDETTDMQIDSESLAQGDIKGKGKVIKIISHIVSVV